MADQKYTYEIEFSGLCLLVRNWKTEEANKDTRCRVLFVDARSKATSANAKGAGQTKYKNPRQSTRIVFDPTKASFSWTQNNTTFPGGDTALRSAPAQFQGELEIVGAPTTKEVTLENFKHVAALQTLSTNGANLQGKCGDASFDNCSGAFAHLDVAGGTLSATAYDDTWTFIDTTADQPQPMNPVERPLALAIVWSFETTESKITIRSRNEGWAVEVRGQQEPVRVRLVNLPTDSYKRNKKFTPPWGLFHVDTENTVDYYFERFYGLLNNPTLRPVPHLKTQYRVDKAPRCAPAQFP